MKVRDSFDRHYGREGNNWFLPLLLCMPRNKTQCTEGRLSSAASKEQDILSTFLEIGLSQTFCGAVQSPTQ